MKKLICLCTFMLFCLFAGKAENQKTLSVLQVNLWHGCSKVPGGDQGVIDLLDQLNADVIFLCETRRGDDATLIPKTLKELEKRGKSYYAETHGLSVCILSKFKPDSIIKTCIVPGDEGRAMLKMTVNIEGVPFAFYSCHLDYRHYECYLPRGYSGTTWKKIEKPITDENEVLALNRLSYRDESIKAFIKEAEKDIKRGMTVIMGGDFNEPSHLDWQANTKDLWDHNGAIINWECSKMLTNAGFKDSYREKHPDPVTCPGFTFPAGNKKAQEAKLEILAWAPEVDERDRIDFIYYISPDQTVSLSSSSLVGPSETVIHGEIKANDSNDSIITPACTWPSDHKGNLAIFDIAGKK